MKRIAIIILKCLLFPFAVLAVCVIGSGSGNYNGPPPEGAVKPPPPPPPPPKR